VSKSVVTLVDALIEYERRARWVFVCVDTGRVYLDDPPENVRFRAYRRIID